MKDINPEEYYDRFLKIQYSREYNSASGICICMELAVYQVLSQKPEENKLPWVSSSLLHTMPDIQYRISEPKYVSGDFKIGHNLTLPISVLIHCYF